MLKSIPENGLTPNSGFPASLDIRLLGTLEVRLHGTPVTTFRTNRVRTLLAFLASQLHIPQERGLLMELLWPNQSTTEDMRQTLSRLRRMLERVGLENLLQTRRHMVCLNAGPGLFTDLGTLQTQLQLWKYHCGKLPSICLLCKSAIESGLALYRGEFCSDVQLDYSEELSRWHTATRDKIRQTVLQAMRALISFQLSEGHPLEAEHQLRRMLELDPFDEEGVRLLLLLLRQRGAPEEGRRFFEDWRRRLRQELGTDPDHLTRVSAITMLGDSEGPPAHPGPVPEMGVATQLHVVQVPRDEVLSVSLLGTFQLLTRQGESINALSRKTQALLAILCLEAASPLPRARAVQLLWPQLDASQGLHNLRQTVLLLQQVFRPLSPKQPLLLTHVGHLQLAPQGLVHVDVLEFLALREQCLRHPHRHLGSCLECLQRLQGMVELYRGELTAQWCPADPEMLAWHQGWSGMLHKYMVEALQHLADAFERQGAWARAEHVIRRWVELEPFQEAAHQKLMLLLALDGRRTAAIRHYEALETRLSEELGTAPEPETAALFDAIWRWEVAPRQAPGMLGLWAPNRSMREHLDAEFHPRAS